MPERPPRQLVLVAAVGTGAPAAALQALATLGVPPAAPADRARLEAAAGRASAGGAAGLDPADGSALLDELRRLADGGDAGDLAWSGPHLAEDVDRWCDVAEAAGWRPVPLVAWQDPADQAATATGPDGPAEALAAWELAGRAALTGLRQRRAAVVPVVDGRLDERAVAVVARALGREEGAAGGDGALPGAAASPADGGAPGAVAGTAGGDGAPAGTPGAREGGDTEPPEAVVLPGQRRLATVLAELTGVHERLDLPHLPAASSWVAALARADDRARRAAGEAREAWEAAWARAEDAGALWEALWQVGDELAGIVAADVARPHVPFGDFNASADLHGYVRWISEREAPPGPPGSAADADPRLADGPLVSVVVPVYKPDLALLDLAVGSVRRQTYPRWELCLCDDGSGDPALAGHLAALAAGDPRIKVTALAANGGISAATNGALAVAGGEWVAFMDQDDELAPDALAAVVAAVLDDPSIDLVYTDDDKIDREGQRFQPQFKPDWDPDLLLSMCYFSHLVTMRRSLVDEVGGLRSAFDGSQDWDLSLRVTERARTIHHIPRVLYHWRAIPGSAALDASYKPWAHEAAVRALTDALDRRGEPGTVEHHPRCRGLYHVRRRRVGDPLVSVVVPFRDGAALLQRCVDSLTVDPGHHRMELLLVDNGSTEPEMAALLDRLSADERVRVLHDPRPFNWAALNNGAINQARGDMVLTLNNDVTAASPGWLHELVVHAQRPEIGAVGARLLYPDGRVQHVGAVVGLGGIVAHPMRGIPGDHPGYMGFATVIRGWSAVTGACMLTRRSVVEEVGGFDEELAVAFNDVDFCLRILERGYRIVCTPLAEMVHAESSTRGFTGYGRDIVPFVTRWAQWLRGEDPMFSPNLSRFDAHCVVRLAHEDAQWNQQLQKLGLS